MRIGAKLYAKSGATIFVELKDESFGINHRPMEQHPLTPGLIHDRCQS
jgi:hypothetical protein